jgi:acyl-[acyl-carrier-protein] desaturase
VNADRAADRAGAGCGAGIGSPLRAAREWFPHQYVPWSDGRNFDGVLGGDAWDPSQSRVSEVARAALVVNLLTEDNLPSYHGDIYESFGSDGAWST